MARKEIITCDICKCNDEVTQKRIDVIFETDQTEGRSTKPYLCNNVIDICENCLSKVTKGNYIFASGAMGYNDYYFKS